MNLIAEFLNSPSSTQLKEKLIDLLFEDSTYIVEARTEAEPYSRAIPRAKIMIVIEVPI